MRRLLLGLVVLGTFPAFAQKAFDGTWRFKIDSGQFKGADKYLIANGVWHCETCVPKEVVPADGKPHKIVGQPYYDTLTVKTPDDRTVELTAEKNGKVVSSSKTTASADGKTLTSDVSFTSQSGQNGSFTTVSDRIGEVPSGNKVSGTWQARKVETASENITRVTFKSTSDGLSMKDQMGDSYDAKFDGKDYPYQGDPGTTSVVLKKIDDNTIEETDKRDGKVTTVARMTVQPNGKTLKFVVDDKLHNQQAHWTAEKE